MSIGSMPSIWYRRDWRTANLEFLVHFNWRAAYSALWIAGFWLVDLGYVRDIAARHGLVFGSSWIAYLTVSFPLLCGLIIWQRLRTLARDFRSRYPEGKWRDLTEDSETFETWDAIGHLGNVIVTLLLGFPFFIFIIVSWTLRGS